MIWGLLIGLIVGLFAGGGDGLGFVEAALDDWEKSVKKHVEDDAREEKALALIERMRTDLDEKYGTISEAFGEYQKVDYKYEATIEDYEKTFANMDESWRKVDNWVLDARFDAKEILSEEEFALVLGRVGKKGEKITKKIHKMVLKSEEDLKEDIEEWEEEYSQTFVTPEYSPSEKVPAKETTDAVTEETTDAVTEETTDEVTDQKN